MTKQEKPKVHIFYTTVPLPQGIDSKKARSEAVRRLHEGAWSLLAESLHVLYPERFPGRTASDLPATTTGDYGKPAFRDASLPEFSLSHSGSMAVCAISECGPVGVDVQEMEDWNEPPEMDDIVERFFHPGEQDRYFSIADPERRRRVFFRLFSCKEAYVKMTGSGLSEEFSSFCIRLDEEDQPVSVCDAKAGQAAGFPTLLDLPGQDISGMYTLAVCVQRPAGCAFGSG